MRSILLILYFMPLLWACSPEDDDKTKVIFSSFNKGSFSVRIFELKVDSTFRYYRNVHGNTTDVNGYWTMEKDTFNLYHKNFVFFSNFVNLPS